MRAASTWALALRMMDLALLALKRSLDWCAGSSPVFRPGIKLSNIDIPGTYTALFWREGGTFLESATFSRMLPCDSCVLSLQQHVARAIASGLRCFQLLGRAACFSFAFGLTPYTISQFESLLELHCNLVLDPENELCPDSAPCAQQSLAGERTANFHLGGWLRELQELHDFGTAAFGHGLSRIS
ncbi:unnamed protein product [Durusdinium trenchii]|uniref:Uncharacterized protein n=1 Tax=Durusdinium trenchii TaxID=1381693 RepID=A0ABP0J191_9DINO